MAGLPPTCPFPLQTPGQQAVPRAISGGEHLSLTALVNYLAHEQGFAEDEIMVRLLDRFSVANLAVLPSAQFDMAVKYLVDQLPAESEEGAENR